ncbi:bacterioferritin comigratory protein [human gut metagenome]|uniref:thioredoxin-dependent peroxiredoxin n=1 Tax=human gut metagenome TaxID=408170 RepID=K1TGS5_9ZZZZ
MTHLQEGDKAPDFRSTTQDGEPLTLADLAGQRTILYFYPKDNTSGCTLEAQSLRDGREELARRGFRIVGVSPDSERSHRNFCDKHALNFTLLADTDHSVCEAYGVWAEKSMYGRKYMGVLRTTFVIDAEGRIEKIFTKVDTKNHYRQTSAPTTGRRGDHETRGADHPDRRHVGSSRRHGGSAPE